MATCSCCGAENREGARFCDACGAPLDAPAGGEERKLVSVLFVDLVGFTACSDESDPEDVRATLRPYHAGVKREIERFGGTVEKFIGDAVMAVFGAPVAHEDDPERAVRAALRVLESIDELNAEHGLELAVRAAVATGEAVVSLSARPGEGEGIATGDVVNVAARLQSEAPVGGLVVGEQTFRSTRSVIEYEELEPVAVKGKAQPLPLWRALRARSRFGVDAEAAPTLPFVGRDLELRLLQETFERTLREGTVQLVTVVGEPGVGKTRLLAEFRGWVDDRPELVYWRQGRCLPYGEGITFWALGEIVKAHAGILESDGPEDAQTKLDAMVSAAADEGDRAWIGARLAPLVGLTGGGESTRDESFTAWQSFLESLAAQRPLVVLFEDLHWGDAALLDFVERLVDWSTGLPVLALCSARPELYDLRPGWGGGKRNSTTVALSPLPREDTARPGALEAMGGASADAVRDGLHSLAQRELVRPMRASSVEGQAEYAFWHALIRDVAYGQIPRAARAERHCAAADWIEAMAGARLADHAELLAYHVTEAISLARAAGDEPDPGLEAGAARFLVLAGDRSSDLDVRRAEKLYRQALHHLPAGSVEHGRVLVKAAEVTRLTGRPEEAPPISRRPRRRSRRMAMASPRVRRSRLSHASTSPWEAGNGWSGPPREPSSCSRRSRLVQSSSPRTGEWRSLALFGATGPRQRSCGQSRRSSWASGSSSDASSSVLASGGV